MEKRDLDDANRAESPLTRDETYVLVDSRRPGRSGVAAEIERRVRERALPGG